MIHMSRSPSVIIVRMYRIKNYSKKLCDESVQDPIVQNAKIPNATMTK
jgi:hypothetical protein